MTCEMCDNLKLMCNLHKPPETLEERADRKAIWIARVTKHFDSPELRKEANDIFEKQNQ